MSSLATDRSGPSSTTRGTTGDGDAHPLFWRSHIFESSLASGRQEARDGPASKANDGGWRSKPVDSPRVSLPAKTLIRPSPTKQRDVTPPPKLPLPRGIEFGLAGSSGRPLPRGPRRPAVLYETASLSLADVLSKWDPGRRRNPRGTELDMGPSDSGPFESHEGGDSVGGEENRVRVVNPNFCGRRVEATNGGAGVRISTSIQHHTAYIPPPLALVLDLLTKNVGDEDKKATPRKRGFAGTASRRGRVGAKVMMAWWDKAVAFPVKRAVAAAAARVKAPSPGELIRFLILLLHIKHTM
ncbi:hypothetical protein BHM03_00057317 [Ensete ventricosum]|nr:hypothetical protein BHM03_00057317 [Ensete ventricosum]